MAGREVDVVDLASASTVMRAQVISGGKHIYCTNETACKTFEDYVYSSYARLNEERRGACRTSCAGGAYMADEVAPNELAAPCRASGRYAATTQITPVWTVASLTRLVWSGWHRLNYSGGPRT